MAPRKKIGEILTEAGLIDQAGLRSALAEQARWGGPLGRILIDLRLVSEANLVAALSKQLHVPAVDLEAIDPPSDVLALVPPEVAVDGVLLPFHREGKFLDVAMSDPTNSGLVDELRIRTKLNIRTHLAGPKALERALARFYHRGAGLLDPSMQRSEAVAWPSSAEDYAARDAIELTEVSQAREIAALQARITKLEALISRDEEVLRKVLALLVEKRVASREEILERIR
jgi:hypothetical protein